jgi:hypothetical protein
MLGSEVVRIVTKKGPNTERLECHTKSTTFEYVYKKELVMAMQDAIKSGNVEIKSKFKLSEHMQTKLATHISLEQVDTMIQKQIDLHKDTTKDNTKKLLIDYFIYENDKKDPGKKTAKSKLYAGYLVFHFLIKGKKVYRLQIDFMEFQGKDIEEKIHCMMKSVLSL